MKTTKFRAWDKKNKRMVSPVELAIWDYYLNPQTGTFYLYESANKPYSDSMKMTEQPDLIPMQLVGEFEGSDGKKNEVWEKDIVKGDGVGNPTETGEVYYDLKGFWAISGNWSLSGYKWITVIGNAYQNPELLEVAK